MHRLQMASMETDRCCNIGYILKLRRNISSRSSISVVQSCGISEQLRYMALNDLATIGAGYGSTLNRRQAIVWINAALVPIGEKQISEICIKIANSCYKTNQMKMSSAKRQCVCVCVIQDRRNNCGVWMRCESRAFHAHQNKFPCKLCMKNEIQETPKSSIFRKDYRWSIPSPTYVLWWNIDELGYRKKSKCHKTRPSQGHVRGNDIAIYSLVYIFCTIFTLDTRVMVCIW